MWFWCIYHSRDSDNSSCSGGINATGKCRHAGAVCFEIRRRRIHMAETNKTLFSTVEIYRDIKICVSWHWNVITGTLKIFNFGVSGKIGIVRVLLEVSSAEKCQQKKGEASTTSLNRWCNTSWWSTQLEKISVKIGNLPQFSGWTFKTNWNHRLARTLNPKRHIQHRKRPMSLCHLLIYMSSCSPNWCAETINLS